EAETGALPVRDGELVHLEVRLNRPAFIYLLWVDGAGQIQPLFPWDLKRGFSVSPGPQGRRQTLDSPPEKSSGWPMDGAGGLDTALAVARTPRSREEVGGGRLIGSLPRAPRGEPRKRSVGKGPRARGPPRLMLPQPRGLKVEARRIDDALLDLLDRLRPH